MNFQNLAFDPTTLIETNFQRLLAHKGWRTTWTQIVAGKFSPSPYSGLMFYSQSEGYAAFYETNGAGGIAFLQDHTLLRKSWTHIIPGTFHSRKFTGLFFYDQSAGFAAIYDTDGKGGITPVKELTGFGTSWTHITTVRIPNSDFSGIVLYDQAAGHGEIRRCDGDGGLHRIIEADDWRTSWTQIVGDPISGSGLLFYEGSTGYGEIYPIQKGGTHGYLLGQPAKQGGLPPATQIIAGNFGNRDSSYFFYDAASGQGNFVMYWPPDDNNSAPAIQNQNFESYTGLCKTWDIVVPGQFWEADPENTKFQDGFTDLLFYDHAQGCGEFYLHEPFNSILVQDLEGFASPGSLYPGENIRFFVNTRVGEYVIEIYRQDLQPILVAEVPQIANYTQPFPISRLDYRDGPAWPPAAEFTIPQDWPSGVYLAHVRTIFVIAPGSGESASLGADSKSPHSVDQARATVDIPFVVRGGDPGNQSSILIVLPDTTYNAYNFWGGRSLYGFTTLGINAWSSGSSSSSFNDYQFPRAFRVAMERPHYDFVSNGDFGLPWQQWETPLIQWLARMKIPVEWCLASDLHRDQVAHTNLLRNYNLVVSVGHDEYWSAEMRANVEGFVAAGGNAAFFSGNVCWWQIRFDDDVKQQICYKDSRFDPEPDSGLVTVNWYDKPVCHAETSLTGVSWYGDAKQYPSYSVLEPSHWVFAGTGLSAGCQFGSQSVLSYETDRYQPPRSNPCLPSSPGNFQRLAEAPAVDDSGNPIAGSHAATMGIFRNKEGQVFTAGAVNWTLGLSQDGSWTPIDQITLNVLEHLR